GNHADKQGVPPAHGASEHDTGPSVVANAVFGSAAVGTTGLGDSFHFKHETSGSGDSTVTDHAVLDNLPAPVSHHDDAAGTLGHPAAGLQALDLPPPVSADDLAMVSDHGKGHVVTHVQHDLIV